MRYYPTADKQKIIIWMDWREGELMASLIDQLFNIHAKFKGCKANGSYFCSIPLVIVAIFLISGLGMGESLEYCYDHPLSAADWSDNVTLPKFNLSLGELTGVQISMNLSLMHDLNLTNSNDIAANISNDVGGNLTLTLPGNNILEIAANENGTLSLSPKEVLSISKSSNNSQSFELTDLDGFAGSSSGDTVLLPIALTSFSSMQMTGGIKADVVPRGAATVCIAYEYIPAEERGISGTGTGDQVPA
jgi:hypothetical protein